MTDRGVVGDGFQMLEFPAASAMEKFQPNTATWTVNFWALGQES